MEREPVMVICAGAGLPGVLMEDMSMQCPMCGQEMEPEPDAASDGVMPDHKRPRADDWDGLDAW